MRWYVSIGAVLVAGMLAGGDVAVVAAPGPGNQVGPRLAEKEANVDVELVLAVDVSYSMDMDELAVQREGYARALISTEFLNALKQGIHGKVAITYFEWAGAHEQRVVVPWRVIDGPESAGSVANEIAQAPLRRAARTGEWVLRCYGWSRPTLSLGRHQQALGRYDLQALAARGIDVVRRPTGGRAILHDCEVTYSVTAPVDAAGPLRASYERVNRLLVRGLELLGVAVAVAERRAAPLPPGVAPASTFHPRAS